jgi:co-chaperonin GroES (HSP10)
MNNFKMFGFRIMICQVEEKLSGELIVPQTAELSYRLGKVVSIGDKCVSPKRYVEIGDVCVYQYVQLFERANTYRFDDKQAVMSIHQEDLIGKLSPSIPGKGEEAPGYEMKLSSFTILGPWVLVKPFFDAGVIVMPDSIAKQTAPKLRWTVVQVGSGVVDKEVKAGDEAILQRSKANIFGLSGDDFCYIHQDYVDGVVTEQA